MTVPGVTEDLVERLAQQMFMEQDGDFVQPEHPWLTSFESSRRAKYTRRAAAVLAAVVPEVRRQVAEEIAVALEAEAQRHSVATAAMVLEAVAAPLAREIGGVEIRPDDDPAPVASCNGRDCGGQPHE